MPGMNSGISVSDPTVVAAFQAAPVRQGLITLVIPTATCYGLAAAMVRSAEKVYQAIST
jgi:tRNA A37 threonylcarbamoyladenosine synthetase subunit TsaC/SUA5/YrdC